MKTTPKQFLETRKTKSKKHFHRVQEDKNPNTVQKYKTELCKTFQATGVCPYGLKCKFAHGLNELITKHQSQNYKKKLCKSFHETGYCPYGIRCSFKHSNKNVKNCFLTSYYLQLFLHKNYGVLSDDIFSDTKLLNGRLPVFENLENEKGKEPRKIKVSKRKSSASTNSNEENENGFNIESYLNNEYKLLQINEAVRKIIVSNFGNMKNFN